MGLDQVEGGPSLGLSPYTGHHEQNNCGSIPSWIRTL